MASAQELGFVPAMGTRSARRGVTLIAASVLLTSLGVTVPGHVAAAAPTGPVSTDAVVSGFVSTDGVTKAGAEVIATAWPNESVLQQLGDGDTVPLKVVGTTQTDEAGFFSVPLDPDALGGQFTGANGGVDIELTVAAGGQQVMWNFTALKSAADDATWSNPRVDVVNNSARRSQQQAPTHLAINLGSEPTIVEDGTTPEAWIGPDHQPLGKAKARAAGRVVSRSITEARRNRAAAVCETIALNEYDNNRKEEFVNAVGVLNAKPVVIQKEGTDHTLGVAVDVAHDGVGFKQSGTMTKSFMAYAETNFGVSNRAVNRVNYRKYRSGCPGDFTYYWRPHSYHSLNAESISIPRPNWNSSAANCATYSNGVYYKTRGSNVVFSTGVDLKVLNVSAESKFTSETQLKWNFTGRAKLCGSTSNGWVSSPQAGAFVA